MIVTEENIGDIVCQHDTGERFQVADITDTGMSILTEDGVEKHLDSHTINGGVEQDAAQINIFQQNRSLGRSLLVAEQAAQRRLTSNHPDSPAAEEASRVSQIVQAQRQAFLDRLRTECGTRQVEHNQSFDDKLSSAKERSASQQNQEPGIQHNNFTR